MSITLIKDDYKWDELGWICIDPTHTIKPHYAGITNICAICGTKKHNSIGTFAYEYDLTKCSNVINILKFLQIYVAFLSCLFTNKELIMSDMDKEDMDKEDIDRLEKNYQSILLELKNGHFHCKEPYIVHYNGLKEECINCDKTNCVKLSECDTFMEGVNEYIYTIDIIKKGLSRSQHYDDMVKKITHLEEQLSTVKQNFINGAF